MNCLLCGAKLAIFRKSSIGDFCSLEHRALYLADHEGVQPGEKGAVTQVSAASRLTGTAVVSGPGASEPADFRSPAVSTFLSPFPAPALGWHAPRAGAGLRMAGAAVQIPSGPLRRRARLSTAGLVLPWSGSASLGFSLSTLVAAAWARDGSPALASEDLTPRFVCMLAYPPLGEVDTDLPRPLSRPRAASRPVLQLPSAIGGSAFDLPQSRAEFVGRRTLDPLLLRRAGVRPEVTAGESPAGLRPVVPTNLVLPQNDLPRIDPKESIRAISQAAAARAAEAVSRYDVEEFVAPRIPPRPAEDDWLHNLAKLMPPAPTLLAIAACAIFTAATLTFLALPKPVFSAASEGQGFSSQIANFRALVRSRSAIRYQDDFRSGLGSWDGGEGWAKDWAYDQAGSLRPGRLGLWRKSMSLTNYRLEFLGQIEKRSLSWVFRAADVNNYHAAKITISKPGPLPLADLVRYTVVDGVAGPRTSVPLPFAVRNDTLYQVQMDIQGSHFATKVNGRIVDSWTDARLPAGGVGFFSDPGEQSRVRWLRVSHRDDFIGRICSYLTAENLMPADQDEVLASASVLVDGETVLLVR